MTLKAWAWAGPYLITMGLVLMRGAILGGIQLFRGTAIGVSG